MKINVISAPTQASQVFSATVETSLHSPVSPSNYTLDCFVTNESAYNEVLAKHRPAVGTTGGYLGVGPCQNFTYISGFRPRLAVIVDARVDNLLEHLMFKLIFERAATPLEYLTLLFSRRPSPGAAPWRDGESPESLIEAFERHPVSEPAYHDNLGWLKDEATRRWPLTTEHLARIDYLFAEFYRRQLDITNVRESTLANLTGVPSLRTVILARNSAGVNRHFLTSLDRYSYVRELQRRDLVIPVLGNLASAGTISQVNQLLGTAGERLAAVYLSNLEEHLIQRYVVGAGGVVEEPNPAGLLDGAYGGPYETLVANLARLPTEDGAVLVRFYFPGEYDGRAFGVYPNLEPDVRSLGRFLRQASQDRPRSIFETYL